MTLRINEPTTSPQDRALDFDRCNFPEDVFGNVLGSTRMTSREVSHRPPAFAGGSLNESRRRSRPEIRRQQQPILFLCTLNAERNDIARPYARSRRLIARCLQGKRFASDDDDVFTAPHAPIGHQGCRQDHQCRASRLVVVRQLRHHVCSSRRHRCSSHQQFLQPSAQQLFT